MIQDIIEEMKAKRAERLPMTLPHEELMEVLNALEPKVIVEEVPPVEEAKPAPKRRSKSAKKGKK